MDAPALGRSFAASLDGAQLWPDFASVQVLGWSGLTPSHACKALALDIARSQSPRLATTLTTVLDRLLSLTSRRSHAPALFVCRMFIGPRELTADLSLVVAPL